MLPMRGAGGAMRIIAFIQQPEVIGRFSPTSTSGRSDPTARPHPFRRNSLDIPDPQFSDSAG